MYRTLIIILFLTNIAFSQSADDVIGKYHLPNNLDVEIFKANNSFSGKIIALNGYEDGQTTDIKNPDKSKRKDSLIGKIIIENLKFDSTEKIWIDGKMYGAEKGMFFNLKITNIKKNEIIVVGSKFLFWRTLSWKKI